MAASQRLHHVLWRASIGNKNLRGADVDSVIFRYTKPIEQSR
jgi:hypothetical protein